jgi:murein DD-endopeptidase MepM/ murein hydrolase activator NlpD
VRGRAVRGRPRGPRVRDRTRPGSILVAPTQRVSTGQPLAQVGNTGSSSGPHLHFEVWVGSWHAGGQPVDPLPLLQQWAGLA